MFHDSEQNKNHHNIYIVWYEVSHKYLLFPGQNHNEQFQSVRNTDSTQYKGGLFHVCYNIDRILNNYRKFDLNFAENFKSFIYFLLFNINQLV